MESVGYEPRDLVSASERGARVTWSVYFARDPRVGVPVYVGMTRDLATRVGAHRKSGPLCAWIAANGVPLDFAIVAEFHDQMDAVALEARLIELLPGLLNKIVGGGGGGRPLDSERGKTLKATKPWLAMEPPMSRRTWYRRKTKGEK